MLNPIRSALQELGRAAAMTPSGFRSEMESALGRFRAFRGELEKRVERGDLTPKVARQTALDAANELRVKLSESSRTFHSVPKVFLDRLIESGESRIRARASASTESLLRETNRLLREGLIEQQIASRAVEFQGKTFSRPISGGAPAPTLDRLIEFHESATQAGDDPAREWARRQLEGIRPQLLDTNDSMRVDRATQRPDQVNARLVARYLEALAGMTAAECEGFVRESLAARDANACCAVFLHAREAPEGTALRWVRAVLDGVSDFPDNAVDSLRFWEVESRSAETKAAVGEAEYAAAVAVAEARMPGLEPPDPSALLRRERLIARPVALPGEAIGLNLEKRGRLPEELLSSAGEEPAVVGAAMESAQ